MFHRPLWKLAATTCVTALLVSSLNSPVFGLLSDDDAPQANPAPSTPSTPKPLTTDPLIPEDYKKAIAAHAPHLFDETVDTQCRKDTIETLTRLPIPLIHKLLIHPLTQNSGHSSPQRLYAIYNLIRPHISCTRSQIDFLLEHTGPLFRQIGAQDDGYHAFSRLIAQEMSPQMLRAITKYLAPLLPQTTKTDLIYALFHQLIEIEKAQPQDIKVFGQKLQANRNLLFEPRDYSSASSETSLRIKGLDLATRPPSTMEPISPEEIAFMKDLFVYHRHDLDDFAQAFSQCLRAFFDKSPTWEEYNIIKREVARLPLSYMKALAKNPHISAQHKNILVHYKDALMTLKPGHLRFLHLFAPVIFFQTDYPSDLCRPFDRSRTRTLWDRQEHQSAHRLRMLGRLTVSQLSVISAHADVFFAKGMMTPPFTRDRGIAEERHHEATEETVTKSFAAIIHHFSSKSTQEIEELARAIRANDTLLKKLNCMEYVYVLPDSNFMSYDFDLSRAIADYVPTDYDWLFMETLTSFSASQVHAIAHHQESLLYPTSALYEEYGFRNDRLKVLRNYLGALSAPEIATFAGHMARLKKERGPHCEAYLKAYLLTTWSEDKRELLLKHPKKLLLTVKNDRYDTTILRALNRLSLTQIEAVIENEALLPPGIPERLSLLEQLPPLTPDEIRALNKEAEQDDDGDGEDHPLNRTSPEQPDKPLRPAPFNPLDDAAFMARVDPYKALLLPSDDTLDTIFSPLCNLRDKSNEGFESFMAILNEHGETLVRPSLTREDRLSYLTNLSYLPTDQLLPLAEQIKRENLTADGVRCLIWGAAKDWEEKLFKIACQEEDKAQKRIKEELD